MNRNEAKLLLSAYRPNGQDDRDPRMAEALELARRDPELGRWFEESRRFDADMARSLQSIPVPENLLASILVKSATAKKRQSPAWKFSWPDFGGNWLVPSGACALTVLLIAAVFLWLRPPGLDTWRRDMIAVFNSENFNLDLETGNIAEARDWLQQRNLPHAGNWPAAVRDRIPIGCKIIAWHGTQATLTCFHIKDAAVADDNEIHLFVLPAGHLADPPPGFPQFAQLPGGWATATWTEPDTVLMLATHMPPEKLRQLLASRVGAPRLFLASTF